MGKERKVYKVLVRKPKGRRALTRPTCRWVEEIRMDTGEIGNGEWIQFSWDRDHWQALVNAVMNIQLWDPRVSHIRKHAQRSVHALTKSGH
jgi:hypothetical protein